MFIMPINTTTGNRASFGAKLSNITIKDATAESVNTLLKSFDEITAQFPENKIKYANTSAYHNPHILGYNIKVRPNTDMHIIIDNTDKKVHNIFIHRKDSSPDNKTIIKSFYYYLGNPRAINPIPEISYSEFDGDFAKGLDQKVYKEGSFVPDNIADKMSDLVDKVINALGIK